MAAASGRRLSFLAIGTHAKKFKPVGNGLEAVFTCDLPLNFSRETFLDFDNPRALGANQMVVMSISPFLNQLKPRRPVTKIKTLNHAQFFQQLDGAINRGQVAFARGQFGKYLLVRERMRMMAQNFENCRARAGDLAGFTAQPADQGG